jgi:hypothetical protein
MTTPQNARSFPGQRDRPVSRGSPRYFFLLLRGFFADLRATISACGFGGVFSIRRNNSSDVIEDCSRDDLLRGGIGAPPPRVNGICSELSPPLSKEHWEKLFSIEPSEVIEHLFGDSGLSKERPSRPIMDGAPVAEGPLTIKERKPHLD